MQQRGHCQVQRAFSSVQFAGLPAQRGERAAVERSGEHFPRAARQIVRLVHQQRHRDSLADDALQRNQGIEHIVVIADHNVADFAERQ